MHRARFEDEPEMSHALRILVVDDNRDHAESLTEVFALEGHEAYSVCSGEEAVRAYESDQFDIAFIDIVMPGKSGIESFLEIKRLRPDAKVYMMSAYSVEQVIEQAMDNGAMGVLSKPVDPVKVLASLSRVGPNGIVLVADDDPEFSRKLHGMIQATGYSCGLVTEARDALSQIETSNDEVLIFDLRQPLMAGVELYSDLRRSGRARPTVLIAPMSENRVGTEDPLSDVELTGILLKPFDPGVLVEKLRRLAA